MTGFTKLLSGLIVMAQNPSKCQLCEEETNIEWKCYECDVLFCDGCRVKIHSKLKISDSHHVLNIKTCTEENSEIFQRAQLKNKPCEKHKKQMCIFYCDECDELICVACLPELHSSHKFQEIEEAFDKKLTAIKIIQEETKKDLAEINKDSQKLEEFALCSNKNFEMDKLKIQNQRTILKMRIDEKAIELVDDLDYRRNKMEERILKETESAQIRKNDLSLKTEKIKSALESFQPGDVFRTFKELKKDKISNYSFNLTKVCRFKSKDTGIIANGFGSLEEEEISKVSEYVEINFEDGQWSLPLQGAMAGIMNCQNESNKFWIYNKENTLIKCQFGDIFVQVEEEMFGEVLDITIDKDGVLYYIENGSSDIKKWTKRKGLKTFANMSLFQPISIHVNENQEIIVGLIRDKECQVVVLQQTKRVKQRSLLDQHSKQLFQYPHKITSIKSGDIWVADFKPGSEGRIVILHKDGKIKSIISKDTVQDKFQPNGLVSTDSGHVIVSSSGRFFIFSQNGSYLDIKFNSLYQQTGDVDTLLLAALIAPTVTLIEKAAGIYPLSPYIGVEKDRLMFCYMGLNDFGQMTLMMKTARMKFID